jgi:hypothetical protein
MKGAPNLRLARSAVNAASEALASAVTETTRVLEG